MLNFCMSYAYDFLDLLKHELRCTVTIFCLTNFLGSPGPMSELLSSLTSSFSSMLELVLAQLLLLSLHRVSHNTLYSALLSSEAGSQ